MPQQRVQLCVVYVLLLLLHSRKHSKYNKNTTRLINYENTIIPLVNVRSDIEGFFNRATYYKLVDIALKENIIIDNILHIRSGTNHYPLGTIA